ncbi:hypothetical protein HN51_068662, partial [Arachis hypogaea]
VGIGEIKKMAFPGANESMSGALYLQKGEDIQSERQSCKQYTIYLPNKFINYASFCLSFLDIANNINA